MVNSLNGISAAEYQAYMKVQNQIINGGVSTPNLTYANDSTQFSTSGCTDGKDDGKIGVFSAIGNTIKGVGKTIVNGVKGMFTGKDGKFSLGKTLLSVATAAACVAFPAVGVAACAIGGTMGAIQVGKGVFKAATAKTDAEAKQAWQDIGGGAFTVGASVVGAKAGVKAVKNTAGPNSALASLDDAATMGQKAAALGKDMIASTKNQAGKIRTAATPYAEAVKYKYEQNVVKNTNSQNMSAAQRARMEKYTTHMAETYENPDIMNIVNNIDDYAATGQRYINQAKDIAGNAIKHPIKAGRKAVSLGRSAWDKAKGYVTEENAQNLWNGIQEAYDNNIKGNSISMLAKNLKGTAKNIWADLSTGKYSYPEVVNKYGYKSVAEVIKYMGGTIYGTRTI